MVLAPQTVKDVTKTPSLSLIFISPLSLLISIVSLSTYKIMKIADATSNEELREIERKLTSASEKMKQALLDLERED